MYRILFYPLLAILALVSLLPLRVHYFFSGIIAWVLRSVVKYRLQDVTINLARSFPELRYGEIKKITKEYYLFMADTIVEIVWSFTRSRKKISKRIEIKNPELINEVYALGKNVVVMAAHQGNWEIFSGIKDLKDYGISLNNNQYIYVYKKLTSKLANNLMCRIRSQHKSVGIVEMNNVLMKMLRERNERNFYFFIADQSPGKSGKVVVNFLNQPTVMINGPEYIARKMSLPVIFLDVQRPQRGKYVAEYTKLCDNAAELEEGELTRKYAKVLEECISNDKVTWLWSHKRWKKRFNKENNK